MTWVFCLACGLSAKSQIDTLFWFAAPEVIQQHADGPIFLRISSFDEPAEITISQPANAAFDPILENLGPNSTISIDLSEWQDIIENKPENTVLPFGLRISGTARITAYYEVNADLNPDIFALKGGNALGTDFWIPFQNRYDISTIFGEPSARAGFDIVASADGTLVTFTPSADFVGHPAGIPVEVSLDAGETYSVISESLEAQNFPTGTRLQSNLPVAITIKHDSSALENCFDLIGDQIVPVDVLGTDYIVMKGFLDNSERFFVTATEDDTEVSVEGVVVATLAAGAVFSQILTTPALFIQTSFPAYVFHVTGFGCEMGGALLPSIQCTGSTTLRFTRSNDQFFGLNIMVPAGAEGNFSLNGNTTLVPASAFEVVPGTDGYWLAAQLSFSTAQINVNQNVELSLDANVQFHLGIIHGANQSGCRYGYFSDFSTGLALEPSRFKCPDQVTVIDAGPGQDTYLWSTGESTQEINVLEPGIYWVNTVNPFCVLNDTIVVSDFAPFPLDITGVLNTCQELNTSLSATEGFESYVWNTGDTIETTMAGPGTWWVTATDENGCTSADTVVVEPLPVPEVFISGPSGVCAGTTAGLTASPGFATYLWSTGDTTQTIEAGGGTYSVTVTDAAGCVAANGIEIQVLTPLAFFNASPNPVFGTGQPTAFTDSSQAAADTIPLTTWFWNFGDGQSSMEVSPIHFYDEEGLYQVMLMVTDVLGCEAFAVLEYEVIGDLTVPNVISPNGDGQNDFFVISNLVRYPPLSLTIWNRWGNEVYFSESYKNDWDSEDHPGGVYTFLIDLTDGRKITGTLTVLK